MTASLVHAKLYMDLLGYNFMQRNSYHIPRWYSYQHRR